MNETEPMDPLLQAFEEGTRSLHVPPSRAPLRRVLLPLHAAARGALARYVRHLRELTERLGVPEKFHATITWTYLILLDGAMRRSPGATFDEVLSESTTSVTRSASRRSAAIARWA